MKNNKRTFKKNVEAMGALLCDDMLVSYYNVDGINKDGVGEAVGRVLRAVGAARANANVFFDRGRKAFNTPQEYGREKRKFFRALFKRINEDFNNELNEAVKAFNAAVPADVKEANKLAVAEA